MTRDLSSYQHLPQEQLRHLGLQIQGIVVKAKVWTPAPKPVKKKGNKSSTPKAGWKSDLPKKEKRKKLEKNKIPKAAWKEDLPTTRKKGSILSSATRQAKIAKQKKLSSNSAMTPDEYKRMTEGDWSKAPPNIKQIRNRLKSELMKSRGELTPLGWKPLCPICGKVVATPDMHESILTRGDVQGMSLENRHRIFVKENSVLVHHGDCHIEAATREGRKKCIRHLVEFEGRKAITNWLTSLYSYMKATTISDAKIAVEIEATAKRVQKAAAPW